MKKKLAIISSYKEDSCANATYARLLEKVLTKHFEVTIFDINPELMKSNSLRDSAENHISTICSELGSFDYVNIHQELGLYGNTIDDCTKRIISLCEASNKLIFTLHGITDKSSDFYSAYKRILQNLRNRPNNKPYHVICHLEKEKNIVKNLYGILNITDYPVTYVDEKTKNSLRSINKKEWILNHGFKDGDILIGCFGVFAESKNRVWVLKALELLPDNYKLVFFGGCHPLSIKNFEINQNTKFITDFFQQKRVAEGFDNYRSLINRTRFFGIIEKDRFFMEAMACVDFVIAPYYQNGQSASGTTSMALELGKRLITTYTDIFVNYRKYWPNSFEMFDIGNFIELKDKILFFDKEKEENLKKTSDSHTPEKLSMLYKKITESFDENNYVNLVVECNIENHISLESHIENPLLQKKRIPFFFKVLLCFVFNKKSRKKFRALIRNL